MPRAPLIQTAEFPYHITNRSNNKEFFYVERDILWKIFAAKLVYLQKELSCQVHCFVLMSNHYHLLISTPVANIAEAMKYLHREVAREANKKAGRINHFFGGRYKWSLINSEHYYWNALKYVLRNPVEARMCNSVTDYPYSSLNTVYPNLEWKVDDIFNGVENINLDLDWLNQSYEFDQNESLRKALNRRNFKLPQIKGGYVVKLDDVRSEKGTITHKSQLNNVWSTFEFKKLSFANQN